MGAFIGYCFILTKFLPPVGQIPQKPPIDKTLPVVNFLGNRNNFDKSTHQILTIKSLSTLKKIKIKDIFVLLTCAPIFYPFPRNPDISLHQKVEQNKIIINQVQVSLSIMTISSFQYTFNHNTLNFWTENVSNYTIVLNYSRDKPLIKMSML